MCYPRTLIGMIAKSTSVGMGVWASVLNPASAIKYLSSNMLSWAVSIVITGI